jgi:hypothetical protein
VNGSLSLPLLKPATSLAGANSQPLDLLSSVFSSATHAAVSQHFRWQAEPVGNNTATPSGKLNLLYAAGIGSPAETGLSINNKGLITFAAGQTLPTVTGNETVSGNVSANQFQSNVSTGTAPFVVKSTTQVPNLNASFLGGMPASSFATHGANSFLGTQSIVGSGRGVFLGDPGCGSQYAGIAFAPFAGCTNYSLVGDGVNTFIGRPPNGTVYFIGLSATGTGATDMQINPDGRVNINKGVSSDGGGLKHGRVTIVNVPPGSVQGTTFSWSTPFADTNYTVVATIEENDFLGALLLNVLSKLATGVDFDLTNTDPMHPHTGTVHLIAMHD